MGAVTKGQMVICAINGIGLLVVLGLLLFINVFYEKKLPQDKLEYETLLARVTAQGQQKSYPLERMVMNPATPSARLRFVELQLEVLLLKDELKESLEAVKPFLYDEIILLVSGMSAEEINTVMGKIILEERIKGSINKLIGQAAVKKIFFTKFVVQ